MMRSMKKRSSFSALGSKERVNVREMADTIADQRMREPRDSDSGGGAPNTLPIPDTRAGHMGEAGAPAGTYNGRGAATSPADGIELMATVISNQARGAGKRDASTNHPNGGSGKMRWPSRRGR